MNSPEVIKHADAATSTRERINSPPSAHCIGFTDVI